MDGTLTQILAALYQAHAQIDALRAEVADLQSRLEATRRGAPDPAD